MKQVEVEAILMLMNQGVTREEVAERYGIKVSSLNQRMRRGGFRWDDLCKEFVPTLQPPGQHVNNGKLLPPRIVYVISMFRMITSDAKEVARLAHYKDEQEMARDLKSHGMVWSSEVHNYVPSGKAEPICPSSIERNTRITLKRPVENNFEQPLDDARPIEIPRYRTGARRSPKTLSMALNLQQILVEISKLCNISQGEIIEVAFIDFCMKYGFREEIKSILSQPREGIARV